MNYIVASVPLADILECSEVNGGCEHSCEERNGGFQCTCFDGYVLTYDGRTCVGTPSVILVSHSIHYRNITREYIAYLEAPLQHRLHVVVVLILSSVLSCSQQ